MDTKEPAAIQAAEILGPKGIHRILQNNKYGLGPNIAPENLFKGRAWTATLCHCIWGNLDATLALRDKLGKMHFNVLSTSVDFCLCLYGGKYFRVVILAMFVC